MCVVIGIQFKFQTKKQVKLLTIFASASGICRPGHRVDGWLQYEGECDHQGVQRDGRYPGLHLTTTGKQGPCPVDSTFSTLNCLIGCVMQGCNFLRTMES